MQRTGNRKREIREKNVSHHEDKWNDGMGLSQKEMKNTELQLIIFLEGRVQYM